MSNPNPHLAEAQRMYEAGEKIIVIANLCGVTGTRIRQWAKAKYWEPRCEPGAMPNAMLRARWAMHLPKMKAAIRAEVARSIIGEHP